MQVARRRGHCRHEKRVFRVYCSLCMRSFPGVVGRWSLRVPYEKGWGVRKGNPSPHVHTNPSYYWLYVWKRDSARRAGERGAIVRLIGNGGERTGRGASLLHGTRTPHYNNNKTTLARQRTHNPTTVYAHNGCTTTVLYCRHSALVIIGRCEQKRQTLTCGTLTSACETLQWFPNLHPVHTPIYSIIIHLYAMTCECRDQTDTTTTHKVFCILCVRAICHNTSFPISEKQYLHCVYLWGFDLTRMDDFNW